MDISFRVNPNTTGKGSFFALFNDNWDDYQYKTSFTLHFYDNQSDKKYIGVIKILHENENKFINIKNIIENKPKKNIQNVSPSLNKIIDSNFVKHPFTR